MRGIQRAGLIILVASELMFIPLAAYVHPALVLTGVFLAPLGGFMYVYPRWEEKVKCPYCGTENSSTYKTCRLCGKRPFVSFIISDRGVIFGAVYDRREYLLRVLVYAISLFPMLLFLVVIGWWVLAVVIIFAGTTVVFVQYWKACQRQKPDYKGGAEQYEIVADEIGDLYFDKE